MGQTNSLLPSAINGGPPGSPLKKAMGFGSVRWKNSHQSTPYICRAYQRVIDDWYV